MPVVSVGLVAQSARMETGRFEIRAALASDMIAIGRIVAQSWQHTFNGLIAPEFLASLSPEQQAARHARTFSKSGISYHVAAVEGSGVVGFASGGPSRSPKDFGVAELYAIYLQPGFERRGIGRALFKAVATELREISPAGFYLTALSVNPHRPFYLSMGGRETAAPDIHAVLHIS